MRTTHKKLNSESNSKDAARVTLSLGLIATYIAVVAIFAIPSTQQPPFVDNIKNILTIAWGLPTLELVIFISLEALSLKYIYPNKIDLMGYNINMNTKIKMALFDSGIEYYIKGIFIYAIYYVPWYLMGKGINSMLTFSIFIVLVMILSFILLIVEQKQKLSEN